MAIVLTPKVSRKRTSVVLLIVALAIGLLALTATAVSGLGPFGADRPAAPSVNAVQSVAGGATRQSEGVAAPAVSNAPVGSTGGCDASGIAGDLVGDASPHQVFESYLAQCRSTR